VKSKHEFLCINCPLGCTLELTEEDGEVLEVSGNECKVGVKYAEEEFRDPRRMMTTTLKTRNGALPLLPVVTADPIPKRLVKEAVRVLAEVEVDAPVEEGQVVYPNVLDTGVDVISSRRLDSIAGD
jgi:CxxC motif-containing protein